MEVNPLFTAAVIKSNTMTKKQRIKEIKIEIRFFKMQLAELLSETGILTDTKRLAISINLRGLEELEQELNTLLNE